MSSKEGNRKEKTPSKRGGKKQGKGKDNKDTGIGDAGDSGDENATKEELQDLQSQQEEQHDEINTLKMQLTEMQGQLEEGRSGNACGDNFMDLYYLWYSHRAGTRVPEQNSGSGTRVLHSQQLSSESELGVGPNRKVGPLPALYTAGRSGGMAGECATVPDCRCKNLVFPDSQVHARTKFHILTYHYF